MAVLRPSQARQAARLRLPLLFSCCLLLGAGLVASRKPSSSVAADAVERLFTKLDSNRDGQLDASEAERYAATAGLDWQAEGWSPQRAAAAGAAALDSSDAGETVSRAELQAHLRVLLQVRWSHACKPGSSVRWRHAGCGQRTCRPAGTIPPLSAFAVFQRANRHTGLHTMPPLLLTPHDRTTAWLIGWCMAWACRNTPLPSRPIPSPPWTSPCWCLMAAPRCGRT